MEDETQITPQQQLSAQQEKSRAIYHKIEGCIDRMIQLYEQAQQGIKSGKDHRLILDALNAELLSLKPIKTVRQHFVHHYRKLSNLNRKIQGLNNKTIFSQSRFSQKCKSQNPNNPQKLKRNQERLKNFFEGYINNPTEEQILQKLIVQHYLRDGQVQCAKVWGEQMFMQTDPNQLFKQCRKLSQNIRSGNVQQAIKWCQHEKLYESNKNILEYELRKMHLLLLVQKGAIQQALTYYAKSFTKFIPFKQKELKKLIGVILFNEKMQWGSELQQSFSEKIKNRYKQLQYSGEQLQKLANQFHNQFLRHHKVSIFDTAKILYDCSMKVSDQYVKCLNLMWEGERKGEQKKTFENLPFSVKLEKEFQYHSQFLCPVTKDVISNNQKVILLSCGHLISQAAYTRISQENRNRRKVKCPICQKQIRPDDCKEAYF